MKIKQAERTILKNIDPWYKYIARDMNGDLTLFEVKPTKYTSRGQWDGERYSPLNVFNRLFEWIKWEDDEPYKIRQLIRGDYGRTCETEKSLEN